MNEILEKYSIAAYIKDAVETDSRMIHSTDIRTSLFELSDDDDLSRLKYVLKQRNIRIKSKAATVAGLELTFFTQYDKIAFDMSI